MRSPALPAAVLLVATVTLAGCSDGGSAAGDDASTSPSSSASTSAARSDSPTPAPDAGTTVDIVFSGGKVTPNGDRVKAEVGKPVTLHITADEGGEIHVHSTPEQEIEYQAGESTKKLTIDKPGVVDVESHDLDQVVVQLQVS